MRKAITKLYIGLYIMVAMLFAFPVSADIGAGYEGVVQPTFVANTVAPMPMPAAHVADAKAIVHINRSYSMVYLAVGTVPTLSDSMSEESHYISQIAEQPNKPPIMI